uniref:Uncharacterized protein n=1 Tax=Seriola dumerili TaxID=41447 RepID=A0A3B4U4K4_SERDU
SDLSPDMSPKSADTSRCTVSYAKVLLLFIPCRISLKTTSDKWSKNVQRMVGADRMATVAQITTLYKWGEQKSISKRLQTLRWMGYNKETSMSGSTPVSQEQKSDTAVETGSPELHSLRLEKHSLV